MPRKVRENEEAEKGGKRRLTIYLAPDVYRAFLHQAIDEDLSASGLAEKAFAEYLKSAKGKGR